MESLSVFAALRAAAANDFFIGLVNNRSQRDPPFAALIVLCVVLVAVSALFFNRKGPNGLAVGTVSSLFVFCASLVLGMVVLVALRGRAHFVHVQKLSYLALTTFTFAVLLFDINLLQPTITYVGQAWDKWLVAIVYCLPYPVFCLATTPAQVKRRLDRKSRRWIAADSNGKKSAVATDVALPKAWTMKSARIEQVSVWWTGLFFVTVVGFSAAMFRFTILDGGTSTRVMSLVSAITSAFGGLGL